MESFTNLLKGSAKAHGHLCPGQVVGVRMAILGCRLIGLDDPQSPLQIKQLIVYVEMDRCTADAVAHVTGVKLGRRSLKFMDYGIMAATFVNTNTNCAFRIISTEESRDLADIYVMEKQDKKERQLIGYQRMPDSALFRVQKVTVSLNVFDLPGPTQRKVRCQECDQVVRDHREVVVAGRTLCKPCAETPYFTNAQEITWENMNWHPELDGILKPLLKKTLKVLP